MCSSDLVTGSNGAADILADADAFADADTLADADTFADADAFADGFGADVRPPATSSSDGPHISPDAAGLIWLAELDVAPSLGAVESAFFGGLGPYFSWRRRSARYLGSTYRGRSPM